MAGSDPLYTFSHKAFLGVVALAWKLLFSAGPGACAPERGRTTESVDETDSEKGSIMNGMSSGANGRDERGETGFLRSGLGAPGIVILDGGLGAMALDQPRVVAFVYGEDFPRSPTLPFGRWKKAS